MKTFNWLIDWLCVVTCPVPTDSSSISKRHHSQCKAVKLRPLLGVFGLWVGRDLYRVTSSVTQVLGFHGLVLWSTRYSHLFMIHLIQSPLYDPPHTFTFVWSTPYSHLCMIRPIQSPLYDPPHTVTFVWFAPYSHLCMIRPIQSPLYNKQMVARANCNPNPHGILKCHSKQEN